jgi:hypothetical protein
LFIGKLAAETLHPGAQPPLLFDQFEYSVGVEVRAPTFDAVEHLLDHRVSCLCQFSKQIQIVRSERGHSCILQARDLLVHIVEVRQYAERPRANGPVRRQP